MKRFLVLTLFFTLIFTGCDNSKKTPIDQDSFAGSDSDEVADTENDESTDIETDEDASEVDDEVIVDDTADETPDEDADEDTYVPEGLVAGKVFSETGDYSDVTASLFVCGNEEAIGSAQVDENGNYQIIYDLVEDTSYCVEAGNWKGCFTASDQNNVDLNVNPMTSLAADMGESNCSDIAAIEVNVRKYLKVGTGRWLTELEYEEMTGIHEGFSAVKAILNGSSIKDIADDVETDIESGDDAVYKELFNGFEVVLSPEERVIEDTTDPVLASLAGNSLILHPSFNVVWTVINNEIENASADVWSDNPGEVTVKAELEYDSNTIAEAFSTAIFYTVEKEGDIDVSDLSANMSYWINEGAVTVFGAGTEVKNGSDTLDTISYRLLSTTTGSNMKKIEFSPSGTTFSGDPIMIIVDLTTEFSGDPIMLGAERMDEGGEVTALNQASGDPIMLTASGDPIMFTASGDPIMNIASGDPIMQPDMANVLVTATSHFSDIDIKKKSMPVNIELLLDEWTQKEYPVMSPLEFILNSIDVTKLSLKNLFADRESVSAVEAELEKLFNTEIGKVRNINLFENLYYIGALYEGIKNKKTSTNVSRYAAVYRGYDLKNFLYDAYVKNMSGERSVALDDIFDLSKLPRTFKLLNRESRIDLRERASEGLAKVSVAELKPYNLLSKKNARELLKYVNATKGPDFGNLNGALDADTVMCMWLSDTASVVDCKGVPGTYSIGDNGRVQIDGTEVTTVHIDYIFENYLTTLPDTMPEWKKHEMFRSLFLAVKYMTALYENAPKMVFLIEGVKKTVSQIFEGLEDSTAEIKLADKFTENVPTVSVIMDEKNMEVPVFGAMFDMLGMIDVVVPVEFNDAWKFKNATVKMHGYGYVETGLNDGERKGFKVDNDMGIKSFVKKDIDFTTFDQDGDGNRVANLAQIFAEENMETFGECYVEISIVSVFTINGDEKVRERKFTAAISQSAENSDTTIMNRVKGKLHITLQENMGEGTPLPDAGISIEPGNILIFLGDKTNVTVEGLPPAFYTVKGFADGFYPIKKTVALNSGEEFNVDFFLDPVNTGTEKGTLFLQVNQTSDGGGTTNLTSSQLLNIILLDHNDVIFEKKEAVDASDTVEFMNVPYGQYSLKILGEGFYPFIESLSIDNTENFRYFTLLAQNTCGNKVVEPGEDCDQGMETGYSNVKCGDMFPGSTYPDNFVYCSYECMWDSASCFD